MKSADLIRAFLVMALRESPLSSSILHRQYRSSVSEVTLNLNACDYCGASRFFIVNQARPPVTENHRVG